MSLSDPAYRLVRLANGATGIFSSLHGEMFHPAVGPEAEAETLYVNQLRLPERFQAAPEPFVIWDVGLGAAGNPIAALRALANTAGQVCLESFDQTAEALRFALANPEAFPIHAEMRVPLTHLAEAGTARFQAGAAEVIWRLHLGDFPAFMRGPEVNALPKPHAVFWDPHSPARNSGMWTLPLFETVFRVLDPKRECLLATYSRSTMVRVAMLLAGFSVGIGQAVGAKEETTVAANRLNALTTPLGRAWLEKAARSGSAEPLRDDVYRQAPLAAATREQLAGHPQFCQTCEP